MEYLIPIWGWSHLYALAHHYEMTPKHTPIAGDPKVGRALKARRVLVGITQEGIEEETGGLLTQRWVSELETGKRSLYTLTLQKLVAYLEQLKWTGEEFSRDTGVEVPTAQPIPGSTEYHATYPVPQFGSVSAGVANNWEPDPHAEPLFLDPNISYLRGRDMTRIVTVTVNGDSMLSPKASESIPHGCQLIVEVGAQPADGEFVIAWIDDLQVSVVKKYSEGGDVVLKSLNPRGPVFRAHEHNIDVRGVVRFVILKPV